MRNLLPIVFVIFLALDVCAQEYYDPQFRFLNTQLKSKGFYGLFSELDQFPTSDINNLDLFILGQYGDKSYRDDLLDKMDGENNFGAYMTGSFLFAPDWDLFGNENLGLSFKYGSYLDQYIVFTKDFATLFYKGNKPFAGNTAILSPLEYSARGYHALDVNLNYRHLLKDGKNLYLNFGMGYIMGSFFQNIVLEDSYLYTSEQGDTIETGIHATYRTRDVDKKKAFSNNGSGMNVNASIGLSEKDRYTLLLGVKKLGFIRWNSKTVFFELDTNILYTGYDLLNDNPFVSGQQNLFVDTINTIGDAVATKAYYEPLDPEVHLSFYRYKWIGNFDIHIGAGYVFREHMMPSIYCRGIYELNEKFVFSAGLIFDKYSNAGFLADIGWQANDQWLINIGSRHLEGYGLTRLHGQNLYLSVFRIMK